MENNYDVFNLGSDKGYSVIELIKAFEEENEVKVNSVVGDRRIGDVVQIYSNSFKARKLLKWKAEKTIDDIVISAWNWHKNRI